jgi:hypothetical protein
MNQEDFNERTLEALTQITETLTEIGTTRDAMYQMIQFESARVDSAEDRIDILMSERGARIEDEEEEKEKLPEINLNTAVKGNAFTTGCGNIATYSCRHEHEVYGHMMMIGDYTHTYTTEGKHNASGESTLDLVSAVAMVDCQVNETENLTCGQLDKSQDEEVAIKYDHKAMSEVFDALKMEEIIEAIKEVEDYVKVNCDHKSFEEAKPESVKFKVTKSGKGLGTEYSVIMLD